MAKRVAGGVAGTLPARIAYGPSVRATSDTPKFGRLAFLAVTENELALIKLKSGVVRVFLDEVVERIPRTEVESAELGGGVAPPLTIIFSDGSSWELEVPRPSKAHAKSVVDVLTHQS
jgi:hypothetical protein